MESAFGWLGRIIEGLISFFPKPFIVRKTHRGVRFRYGNDVRVIEPGFHFCWPLVTEVTLYPVVRQTVNLDSQTLCTKDGKVVGVAGVVIYKINNIEDFLTITYDGEDTIRDMALASIAEVITTNDLAYLQANREAVHKKLINSLRSNLAPFGVGVNKVTLTDLFPILFPVAIWNPSEGKWSASQE